MNKTLSIVILLSFTLLLIAPASAEGLNNMSDEELIEMYREIQSILLSRSGNYEIQLNAGRYVIGQDLPSGSYRIEAKGAYSSSTLKVFDDSEAKYPNDTFIMAELYNSSIIGKLDLEDGNILEITGSTVSIAPYSAAQVQLEIDESAQPASENDASDAEPVDSLVVPPGKYQVGPEIPQGTYRVVCEEAYGMASFSVFDSEKAVFPSYNTLLSPLVGNAEIGKIELKKGSYVEVAEGSVTLYTYTGLGN